jgi:hypothetical protein
MPRTKQMESRMLDLPDPLRPVMALKKGSKPDTTVRVAYDLKPSRHISLMYILQLLLLSPSSSSSSEEKSEERENEQCKRPAAKPKP